MRAHQCILAAKRYSLCNGVMSTSHILMAIIYHHQQRTLNGNSKLIVELSQTCVSRKICRRKTADLTDNGLTEEVAFQFAYILQGRMEEGRKVEDSPIKRIILNENPMIGGLGAAAMFLAMNDGLVEHIEMRNINAGPSTGRIIGTV